MPQASPLTIVIPNRASSPVRNLLQSPSAPTAAQESPLWLASLSLSFFCPHCQPPLSPPTLSPCLPPDESTTSFSNSAILTPPTLTTCFAALTSSSASGTP